MRVLITGGTGFIGFHSALALMDAGHDVRLLVRSEEKMLGLYGNAIDDFVVGDVTDEASVVKALEGCDGLIHAAAMVSIDKRDAQRVYDTNVGGTRLVVGNAVRMGLSHIIHVSSVTALFDAKAKVLTGDSPPGTADSPYGRSKVESELYVRQLQGEGAPVHITYPASVIGPDDPTLTEPHQGLKVYLAGIALVMPSGNQWVDVRDVAAAHLTLLESSLPPGRYTLGGHYLPWGTLIDTLNKLTGRRAIKLPVLGATIRVTGRIVDVINSALETPLETPVTHEAAIYATRWVPMDNSKTVADLGIEFRPVEETFTDAIRGLVNAGHVTRKAAGKLV
ncbi:MAG: SDR family NAD(P)-dependent oxidoreductase [Halioglobus sp.]